TDDRPAKGAALARELGTRLIALRGRTHPEMLSVKEATARLRDIPGRPVVAADVADNPGGGFPGDNTDVLRKLLALGVQDVAFAILWAPMAVSIARAAGPGARLALRVGGKMGVLSGQPLDLDVTVTAVTGDLVQRYWGVESSLGPSAALRVGGIDIVIV